MWYRSYVKHESALYPLYGSPESPSNQGPLLANAQPLRAPSRAAADTQVVAIARNGPGSPPQRSAAVAPLHHPAQQAVLQALAPKQAVAAVTAPLASQPLSPPKKPPPPAQQQRTATADAGSMGDQALSSSIGSSIAAVSAPCEPGAGQTAVVVSPRGVSSSEIQPLLAANSPAPAAATADSPPVVEVELQRRSSDEQCSSSTQASPYGDLLLMEECWAGPGLRTRSTPNQPQSRPEQQGSIRRQSSKDSIQMLAMPPSPLPGAPAPKGLAAGQLCAPHPEVPSSPRIGRKGSSSRIPLLSRSSSSGSLGSPRSSNNTQQQQVQQQRLSAQQGPAASIAAPPLQRRQLRWWLFGGVALAAASGGAVLAVYGIVSYMLKATMIYSFAWKAATGVAAAEGLAMGGWSCSSVKKEKALTAQTAAELARLRSQAARDLATLRGLLQQKEADHGQEVAGLSTLNERLNRLAQSLRAENTNLQSALDRAAAERKSLEAAAALEHSRAETSAVVGVAAAHSERVVEEVLGLARSQQQLVALVCELREDLLGLVADHAAAGTGTGAADHPAAAGAAGAVGTAGSMSLDDAAAAAGGAGDAGLASRSSSFQAGDGRCTGDKAAEMCSSLDSAASSACEYIQLLRSAPSAQAAALLAPFGVEEGDAAAAVCSSGSSVGGVVKPLQVRRMTSVRGNVDAALAATIAETLQL